ncbi:helix-turn-helix transcriptional regulator [Shimazuella kribbensis]|uniref:helix-turn-helix transcriptional regulator n=1 Tax=Shimazuella kribbensis TaxID=139808 RepID=UPI00041AEB74|nr:helix-turn-helix transcriptional regulator [Shimazuella kribbensis]
MRKDIIGAVLVEERKKQGKRILDVANELGIGSTTISSMERGLPTVADEKYIDYAKLLGKAEELFGIEEEMKKRERFLMEELQHMEDILTGNPCMALEEIESFPDLQMFQDVSVFATFLRGRIAFELKRWNKANKLLLKALTNLDQCPRLAASNLRSICLNDLGRLAFYDSDYKTALGYTEQAIDAFEDEGNRKYYKPYLYLNQVIYLEELGRDEEACHVLEYLYNNKNQFKANLTVTIQIHEQYSNLLMKSGSPLKALEYAQNGLKIAWENREYRRLFSIWSIMGDIFVMLGRAEEAKKRYQKALSLSNYVLDSPARIGQTNFEYGKLLLRMDDHTKAEEQLLLAVKYFEKSTENDSYLIESLINLGRLKEKNQTNNSKEIFQMADELLSNSKDMKNTSVDIFIGMCDFYERNGDKQKFHYYQNLMYQTLKRSV